MPPERTSYAGELRQIRDEGRWRSARISPVNAINLASNDYLNLAQDPRLKAAAASAVEQYGCGAAASPLVCGYNALHAALEQALAGLCHMAEAVVFPSGYQANLAVLPALAGEGDTIFSDQLNHASIIDSARLSRAQVRVFRHSDAADLAALLKQAPAKGRRIIVTDALFSMDGDVAPVAALRALADEFEAILVVDEAHALGVFGGGAGICQAESVYPDVLVGTLSKSLGSAGGFVAASNEICSLLRNRGRSYIFSTGLSPACAGSALAAVEIIRDNCNLGEQLLRLAAQLSLFLGERGIAAQKSMSQVIPIILGDNFTVMDVAVALRARGVLVGAIRPPSVPEGTARLRLSVTLANSPVELADVADAIAEACSAAAARAS